MLYPLFLLLCQSYFWQNVPKWMICCELYPPLLMTLIYCALVIFFLPLIPNLSEMNRFSLSLMHSNWFLVAVLWLNLQDFPKVHLPVINNCRQYFCVRCSHIVLLWVGSPYLWTIQGILVHPPFFLVKISVLVIGESTGFCSCCCVEVMPLC